MARFIELVWKAAGRATWRRAVRKVAARGERNERARYDIVL
jgi:hypothetical protein